MNQPEVCVCVCDLSELALSMFGFRESTFGVFDMSESAVSVFGVYGDSDRKCVHRILYMLTAIKYMMTRIS